MLDGPFGRDKRFARTEGTGDSFCAGSLGSSFDSRWEFDADKDGCRVDEEGAAEDGAAEEELELR